ncbi:hypothetical protein PoB_002492800 [Plakobranchus ocellatus]|uniref:Uncharacterized protein n=1 Tax=Plakobranchus ocellatus TaxID=259542 RepID=A0AAV3ZVG0_9GAST|nr:hypothetical protein PoB_002492800 [Plakobranchus ocellatus]
MYSKSLAVVTSSLLIVLCLQGVQSNPTQSPTSRGLWGQLNYETPSTPSPENVNCYVEIPSTTLAPGRCSRLGQLYTCQAGVYMATSDHCARIMNAYHAP